MRTKILGIKVNEFESRQLSEYARALDKPMSRVVRHALRRLYELEPAPQANAEQDAAQREPRL